MQQVKKVVIAGGGTAGWVTAAALSKQLANLVDVTLVESEEIGTVGVGEATIPPMLVFHKLLGIDEQAFMRATHATFKLGISFEGWGDIGERYIHPFGTTGKGSFLADFQHYWLHGKTLGIDYAIDDYCYELQAAEAGRFARSDSSSISYAYHLDAGRYAKFLREFSEQHGARRIEGRIARIEQDPDSQHIRALVLASGQRVEGDLFIDCSGFRGLLIEQTLQTGYENWQHWLPCDSAVVVQTESADTLPPYTRAMAHDSGWQWRIPLQHRVGNGLVYSSAHLDDDSARERLMTNLETAPLTEPRLIRYQTGRRKQFWNKNCIAMGLSSGFVEPLESTSIYLFMNAVVRLLKLFPFNGMQSAQVDEYNRQSIVELEKIRDFIILHYHLTRRDDSAFWRYCRTMAIPDSLKQRMALFHECGQCFQSSDELFRLESWVHVMLGQGLMPQGYNQLVAAVPEAQLRQHLQGIRQTIGQVVGKLPPHQEFIRRYCQAEKN